MDYERINNQNNKIVSMMVLKTVASNVGVKFELIDTTNGQVVHDKELQLPTTLTNGDWEHLHFDFSSEIGTAYNRLVIIPDFADRSQDHISYIDHRKYLYDSSFLMPNSTLWIYPYFKTCFYCIKTE